MIEKVLWALSGLVSAIILATAIWTTIETRKQFYREYLGRKRSR